MKFNEIKLDHNKTRKLIQDLLREFLEKELVTRVSETIPAGITRGAVRQWAKGGGIRPENLKRILENPKLQPVIQKTGNSSDGPN